jgi:murein DD-endopeptidase MepM/ murein hydrolase activator NlpD
MIVRITSRFGEISPIRNFRPHTGVDLSYPEGSELHSVGNAVVERIVNDDSLGKGVVLKLADNREVIYGHLSNIKVKAGQILHEGQVIGLSGNTGNSTGPHLHLALKENGQYIDPSELVDKMMNVEQTSIGGFLFDKLIQSRIEHFIADFIVSLPILVGVSLAVWALLNMVSSRLATAGVVGVFLIGGLVLL